MQLRYIILPILGFLCTLVFELAPDDVRGQYFLLCDVGYPDDPDQWGQMAGEGMYLQTYLNNLGDYIQLACWAWFVFLNARDKEMWFVLAILFTLSTLNYVLNNHQPFVPGSVIDMNYLIATWMMIILYTKMNRLWN